METNQWQVCPMCGGAWYICPVCNGEHIISTITGLPPSKHKFNINIKATISGRDLKSVFDKNRKFIDKPIPPPGRNINSEGEGTGRKP